MVAAVADDWTKSAMRDGGVVAEMLLTLKEAKVKPLVFANPPAVVLRWGIRQPRSRSPRCDGVSPMKDTDSAKYSRCSPSSPLSWSGGCAGGGCAGGGSSSPSAYADGYETTSRQISGSIAVGSRSKIDSTGSGFGTKRLRINKTFKEEGDSLWKERLCLKKEIATPQDELGAEDESLKRMQLDLNNTDQSDPFFAHRKRGKGLSSVDDEEEMEKMTDDNFLLPDLNMMPSDEKDTDYSPPLCKAETAQVVLKSY